MSINHKNTYTIYLKSKLINLQYIQSWPLQKSCWKVQIYCHKSKQKLKLPWSRMNWGKNWKSQFTKKKLKKKEHGIFDCVESFSSICNQCVRSGWKMKSNALFMRVGKLSHLMPSVSVEVTGSEQCCTAGVSLDKVREGKKSGRGKQRKWRWTVWSHWGETTGRDGYYLSLPRRTEKTSTGDKKMDGWHMLAFWVIKQKAKTFLLWLFI